MRMQITFKSGAQVEVEMDEWETSSTGARWSTSEGQRPKLVSLDLNEVAAVVRLK